MNKNVLIAGGVLALLIIWMLTGLFSCGKKTEIAGDEIENLAFKVRAIEIESDWVSQEIILNGKTMPDRKVTLRAEIESKVIAKDTKRGEIEEGTVIVRLDEKDLRYRLQEAEALVEQRELEFKAADSLFSKQLHPETKLAEAKSALEHARATLEKTSIDLKNTEIKAPFNGILQSIKVEVGDYVRVGEAIAEIIALDPLTITAQVSERQVHDIFNGMKGICKLSSGKQIEAEVTFVSLEAGTKCRTFTVDLEVPNPDNAIAAGETVQIILSTEPIEAHKIPLSALVLNDEGILGVKILDDEDVVHFIPASMIKSTTKDTWLTGLPKKARIIILGQHYVQNNEKVTVELEKSPVEIMDETDSTNE